MYKKGTGNDKQGKDAGNRTLRPYRNFSQAISSCKTQVTAEKNLSRCLRYDLVQLEGNSCSSTSLKKGKVGSINLRDKLQFVNSV